MAYGDNREKPKIDIYVDGEYRITTTWANTCKEAKERFLCAYPDTADSKVVAHFRKAQ